MIPGGVVTAAVKGGRNNHKDSGSSGNHDAGARGVGVMARPHYLERSADSNDSSAGSNGDEDEGDSPDDGNGSSGTRWAIRSPP